MTASAEFLSLWRSAAAISTPVLAANLDLQDSGSGTLPLHLSTADVYDATNGIKYQPAISGTGSIRSPGGFLSSDVALASATITLQANFTLGTGQRLGSLLASHRWVGAPITLYLTDAALFDGSKWLRRFVGTVQSVSATRDTITLQLLQDRSWNRPLNTRVINKADDPHAPDDAIGGAVPVAYGEIGDVDYRAPWGPRPIAQILPADSSADVPVNKLRGGRRTASALLVDTGRGGGPGNPKAKVLVAGHKCKAIGSFETGGGFFYEDGGRLIAIEPANAAAVGSAFHAWVDGRGAFPQVYVQKVGPNGEPEWTLNGVQLSASTATVANQRPRVVADGRGGCWVAWAEDRGAANGDDIYVTHVNNGGVPSAAGGVLMSSATGNAGNVEMVKSSADALGGVILLWSDPRSGTDDLYVGRITDALVTSPYSWVAGGTALAGASGVQDQAAIVGDGSGGVIAAWRDARTATAAIYVGRVNSNGNGLWAANGVQVSNGAWAVPQSAPAIAADGTGGAYVAWIGGSAATSRAIATRRTSTGVIDPAWLAGGQEIFGGAPAGAHGAVAVVQDGTSPACFVAARATAEGKVRVQKYATATGATPAWTASGRVAGDNVAATSGVSIACDGVGGVLVAWTDGVGIRAQRLDANGATMWGINGIVAAIPSASSSSTPTIVADGNGGAILAWSDNRSGGIGVDAYTCRVSAAGVVTVGGSAGVPIAVTTGSQAQVVSAGTVDGDIVNETTEAGFTIPDGAAVAYYPCVPTTINELQVNQADNPRALLDEWNDINFVKFDHAAMLRQCQFTVEGPSRDVGDLANAYFVIGYRSSGAVGFKVRMDDPTSQVSPTYLDASLPDTGGQYRVHYFSFGSIWGAVPLPAEPWSLGTIVFTLGWFGSVGDAGLVEVYFANVTAKHVPRQEVLTTARTIETTKMRPTRRRTGGPGRGRPHPSEYETVMEPYVVADLLPAVTEMRGKFFANVKGWMDDAAGTYTGTPYALIDGAPDIMRHLLQQYGAVPSSAIAAPGTLGSFADARTTMLTRRQTPMRFAISIGETVDVSTAISWIAASSASWCFPSEFDGTWRLLPWRDGQAVDYWRPIEADDVLNEEALGISMTPDSSLTSTLRLLYGYDAASKSFKHETSLGATKSSAGHQYRNLRDQYLTVVAGVNDKIDFRPMDFTTMVPKTAILAPGDYTGTTLMVNATSAMKAVSPTHNYAVSYGTSIVTGFNDVLRFNDGVADRTATVAAGEYGSCESLAAAVAAAMNAVSSGWSVTYSRATRLYTVARSSPTGTETLYTVTGTIAQRRMWAVLGFRLNTQGSPTPLPATAAYGREEKTFAIQCEVVGLDLLWETGPYGLNGLKQGAHELFGFDNLRDSLSLGDLAKSSWTAPCPKGNLEQAMRDASAAYGLKRDVQVEGRAIYDTETARTMRETIAAMMRSPRTIVKFASERVPDLERGSIFQFAPSMDAVLPCPRPGSGGSWANVKLKVLETMQSTGLAWHTEVVAIDVS